MILDPLQLHKASCRNLLRIKCIFQLPENFDVLEVRITGTIARSQCTWEELHYRWGISCFIWKCHRNNSDTPQNLMCMATLLGIFV
jgi:hypothetical protein